MLSKGKYRTQSTYDSLYQEAEKFKCIADCSHYFHHPDTAKLIYDYNPNAKVLVVLRNPIDRIYSEYLLYARIGTVSESFYEFVRKAVVEADDGSFLAKPNSRLEKGNYVNLLKPWMSLFGESQLKIILFDDMVNQTNEICKDIYLWLGVDTTFVPSLVRAQRGGIPKEKMLVRAVEISKYLPLSLKEGISSSLRWKIKDFLYSKVTTRKEMDEKSQGILKQIYIPYICELEYLLGQDLSAWK